MWRIDYYKRFTHALEQIADELHQLAELQRNRDKAAKLELAKSQDVSSFAVSTTKLEDKLVNLKIFDNGKGILFTAIPDHKLHPDEIPTWRVTEGEPGVIVLTPSDDGLSCVGTIPDPPVDATNVVVSISVIRDSDKQEVTQAAAPFDIVPPEDNDEVTGFTIQESAQ